MILETELVVSAPKDKQQIVWWLGRNIRSQDWELLRRWFCHPYWGVFTPASTHTPHVSYQSTVHQKNTLFSNHLWAPLDALALIPLMTAVRNLRLSLMCNIKLAVFVTPGIWPSANKTIASSYCHLSGQPCTSRSQQHPSQHPCSEHAVSLTKLGIFMLEMMNGGC